jgi:fatty acid desaturase
MSNAALFLERKISNAAPDPDEAFTAEDRITRNVVRGLHQPRPATFWVDFLISSAVGWAALALAVYLPIASLGMAVAGTVAIFLLYRGLCFVHEISHVNRRALPGFEFAYNALIGYPLLMPSFVYADVHSSHHRLSTYGTRQDPEYLPFAQNRVMPTVFAVGSFFVPVALLLRFLILTPIGLALPRLQRWLVAHASSLTMNHLYEREATAELVRSVRRQSLAILLVWGSAIMLAAYGILPWRAFGIWLAVVSVASFINTLRTLGAHAYESSGEPLDRQGQLSDSIDTPGALWTELWAPVGLRYHALHHYFPGIPYHNLPEAYRRLVRELPSDAAYHQVRSPGLRHSLARLYQKGPRHAR